MTRCSGVRTGWTSCAKPSHSRSKRKHSLSDILTRTEPFIAEAALGNQQMNDEGVVFARLLTEPAAREAFAAFAERRKPDFSRV